LKRTSKDIAFPYEIKIQLGYHSPLTCPLPRVGGEGKREGELPEVKRKTVLVFVKSFVPT
jgi:hypothetical protein